MTCRDTDLDPREVIDTVARRADIVSQLVDGPKHKRDLTDEMDISRSTVYKAIRELEASFIAERTEDGYQPTLMGRLLFEEYERFYTTVRDISRPGQLLAALPKESDVGPTLLNGADCVFPERHAPNRPVHSFEEMVREATAVKGLISVVRPRYVEVFRNRLLSGELRAELVLECPVVESLRADYREAFDACLRSGNVTVRETHEQLPFGLLVVEEPIPAVRVTVYNASGGIQGVITNRSDDAVEWGRSFWQRHRRHSTEIELEPLDGRLSGESK